METLFGKLNKIQTTLKAPKDKYNSFGKYSYRSCEGILEAVKPLLAETGLVLTVEDTMVEVGGRIYVKATAKITDGEKIIENSAYAREEETKKGMDASQLTGATSSYARKYALNGLLCIDDNKDADDLNTHKEEDDAETEIKKQVANEKRKDTIEKKKEVKAEKNTKEYALQRFDGGMLFVKKLPQIVPEKDTAVMNAINEVSDLLYDQGLSNELAEFQTLVNSKMVKPDEDKIIY